MRYLKLSFFVAILCYVLVSVKLFSAELPESYTRNSVTVFFVDYPGANHWSRTREKIPNIEWSDKFDNHNLEILFLRPGFSRENLRIPADVEDAFLNDLKKLDVGRNVITQWYNRKADGTMDMELVHQRGRFAATDADYFAAASTTRGDAALQDMGNELVNKSFVLIIDLRNIRNMSETDDKDNLRGWTSQMSAHLYRVDFNEEIRNAFYETWLYEDDSPEVKRQKREAFESLEFPLEHVANVSLVLPSTINSTQTRRFGTKSDDQLLQELVQKAYDDAIFDLERRVEAFKVVTPLYGRRPLRAKIGLKEGLRTDFRFFVYEHVYNQRSNTVVPVRRGVIRARGSSRIHDNRHEAYGDMGTSDFYQVAGRRLEEGFTIVQRNDMGFEITLGGEAGGLAGFYSRLDYRTGRFTGIRSLFVYVDLGIDSGYSPFISSKNFTLLSISGGLAKGMQITRNIELRPYAGFGLESASNDDFSEEDAFSAYFVKPGVNLALNLTHNFQLIMGLSNYVFITDAVNEGGSVPSLPWDSIFSGRSGGSTMFGAKIMF